MTSSQCLNWHLFNDEYILNLQACIAFCILGIIYHCDLTKEELEPRVFREVTIKGFDPSVYQTIQVKNMNPAVFALITHARAQDNWT